MWITKDFESQEAMQDWLKEMEGKIQYEEIFVDNGYAIEYRELKVIDI